MPAQQQLATIVTFLYFITASDSLITSVTAISYGMTIEEYMHMYRYDYLY